MTKFVRWKISTFDPSQKAEISYLKNIFSSENSSLTKTFLPMENVSKAFDIRLISQ